MLASDAIVGKPTNPKVHPVQSHKILKNTAVAFSELGHGAQFKTYDMQNGRVLKIPLTEAETYQVARRRRNIIHGTAEQIASLEMRVQTFMNSKARIPAMVGHGLQEPGGFLRLLGNPAVATGGDLLPDDTHEKRWAPARFVYTQDKVEMASHMLRSIAAQPALSSKDEKYLKKYIEDYVALVHETWCYGYADYIFKLGDTGVSANGEMIVVDLGEWTSDFDFIRRAVEGKWWHDNVNHQKDDFPKLPPSLEDFYVRTLDSALTVGTLEKLWRSKHICVDCTEEATTIAAFVSTKAAEIDYIDRL